MRAANGHLTSSTLANQTGDLLRLYANAFRFCIRLYRESLSDFFSHSMDPRRLHNMANRLNPIYWLGSKPWLLGKGFKVVRTRSDSLNLAEDFERLASQSLKALFRPHFRPEQKCLKFAGEAIAVSGNQRTRSTPRIVNQSSNFGAAASVGSARSVDQQPDLSHDSFTFWRTALFAHRPDLLLGPFFW